MKKTLLLLLCSCLLLGGTSFKSLDNKDTLCGINYYGVDSEGCTYSVVGVYDCEGGFYNGVSTFIGTITFGGPGSCYNLTFVEVSYAAPINEGGWCVPANYSYAFYITGPSLGGSSNICNATGLTWIGANAGIVSFLNRSSRAFLDGIKKDVGCR